MNSKHWPAWYEISVDELLDDRWADWLAPMRLERVGDLTILSGALPDQPALHGVLERLRDLNACIVSVRRIPSRHRNM